VVLPGDERALTLAGRGSCESDLTMRDQTLIPSFQRPPSKVVIRRVAVYEQDLSLLIQEGLSVFNPPVKDKTVLLKPNMVGLDPLGVINTHPAVIAAARECFLRLGAAQVLIGDGPAMDRDTEAIVESVRLREYTGPLARSFVDLNVDDVQRVVLKTHASRLKELYLPKTALGVDFLVSMPKLKTHHWAGVTLSLKNMFGIALMLAYRKICPIDSEDGIYTPITKNVTQMIWSLQYCTCIGLPSKTRSLF